MFIFILNSIDDCIKINFLFVKNECPCEIRVTFIKSRIRLEILFICLSQIFTITFSLSSDIELNVPCSINQLNDWTYNLSGVRGEFNSCEAIDKNSSLARRAFCSVTRSDLNLIAGFSPLPATLYLKMVLPDSHQL